MVVYAKSYPKEDPETLLKHTKELLNRLDILKSLYSEYIDLAIPDQHKTYFWRILELTVKIHDLGKIHTPFQNKIRKVLSKELINCDTVIEELPHNLLSPAFLNSIIDKELPEAVKNAIYQAVAFHHNRGTDLVSDEAWRDVVNVVENDLRPNIDRLSDIQKELGISINSIKSSYRSRLLKTFKGEDEKFYIMLKGLLHRLDHAASAHLPVEEDPINNATDLVTHYLTQKKNTTLEQIWQRAYFNEHSNDKNIIFQASTGSGKTEFALYWLGNHKGYYTLPVRTSVNAMYKRLQETYNAPSKIGLLHSDNYFYAIEESRRKVEEKSTKALPQNEEGFSSSLLQMDITKQLSMPITVSTADQLFTSAFKYKGYEKIYATLAYSKVIVDEIQSYDPDMVAVILKSLKDIAELGGKFCLVTATLPKIYIDDLKNELERKNIPLSTPEPRFNNQKRHHIKLLHEEISATENLDLIGKLYKKYNRVLVIVNTVKRSQELYDLLHEKYPTKLLHSRFIYKDRQRLENGDEEQKGILDENPEGIWITTQLAEASLDISFESMVTEISTIDSQVQRWGRVWRHQKYDYDGQVPNVYIYTLNASGIGSVYDKSLVELTEKVLDENDNQLLSQKAEYELVQSVFEDKDFTSTDYYRKFEVSKAVIEDPNFSVDSRREAQRIFRKIANEIIIPSDVYEKNEKEIKEAVHRLLEKDLSKKDKWELLYTINQYCLSLPIYEVERLDRVRISENSGIWKVGLTYDPIRGTGEKKTLKAPMI